MNSQKSEIKDLIINLYNEGKMDTEIAKELNVTRGAVQYWRKKLGLESKFTYSKISKIDDNKFKELFYKGFSDYKIAKELNMSPDGVYSHRMRHGYFRKSLKENIEVSLTKEQKEVLIGIMLGDGHLSKSNVNPRFATAHCEAQKEYSIHIVEVFNSLSWKWYKNIPKNPDKRTGKIYESYRVESPANPALLEFYNSFYINRKKIIPIDLLEKYFTEKSLAYLYMDDGTKTKSGYIIATNNFTKKEIDEFRIFLKRKFDLETSLHRDNVLYIRSISKDTFTSLINPYIIPCMQYKIHR